MATKTPDSNPIDSDVQSKPHQDDDGPSESRNNATVQLTDEGPIHNDNITEEPIGSSRIYHSGNSDVLTVTGEFEVGEMVNLYRGIVDGTTAYLRVEPVAIE